MFDMHRELNAFYREHVRLGRDRRRELAQFRESNLTRLKSGIDALGAKHGTKYEYYKIARDQGGYAMHTLNQHANNEYDLDEGLIFEAADLPQGPSSARTRIRDAFKEKPRNFLRPPKARTNAVTVWYADGRHLDFAVYRRRTGPWGNTIVEHSGGDTWTERDPEAMTNWFKDKVGQLSPNPDSFTTVTVAAQQLRRIVRFLKFFCRSRASWNELLHQLGYTLQANRKSTEGAQHPDRDAQFNYLNEQVRSAQQQGHPVISVDTKKKELVGEFKNGGREWRAKGDPEQVKVHDFVIPEQGKAIPYGVYDLSRDEGWVSVGVDHDTAHFAVNAIRSWWNRMGRSAYGGTGHLVITADAGGSNSPRTRLWKWELQRFANRTGLTITVCHYPPGTSKWNRIEHRLFSYIAMNWRGKPLVSLATVVNLIGATTTASGLRVRSEIDTRSYPQGVKVTDEQMKNINLSRHEFHGDWNYTIRPTSVSLSQNGSFVSR